jgi:hypothetical protein
MYDNEPKKNCERTQRDKSLEYPIIFSVNINGFNDGQQDYHFMLVLQSSKWIVL